MILNTPVVWPTLWYVSLCPPHFAFSGSDLCPTQVNIKPLNVPSGSSEAAKAPRPGVHSLPRSIRRTFAEDFVPVIIQEMGCSSAPWQNLDLDTLQECVNLVYPGHDYVVKKGDALVTSVSRVAHLSPAHCAHNALTPHRQTHG